MRTFKVVTLGCRTNQYESQAFVDQLRHMGYEKTEGAADLCIVNTCTVTHGADRSSRRAIRSLLRDNPGARVAVTGCMAERSPEAILAIDPKIELIPNRNKEQLVASLFPEEKECPEFAIQTFDEHTRAFVKVQDGCNSFCTYCIIPYVRGRSRSRPIAAVVEEVKGLVQSGYKEVVITGINVGDFDGGGSLADLVRAIDPIEGLRALRISSIDPDEVDGPLLQAVLQGKVTCPSMHIVLQSGSNVVLKRMNRKYTRQIFLETVETLRREEPDFTVTTDVIVGFPGETEDDFAKTCEVIAQVECAKVHMFPFSPRERTRAALYPNRVPPEVVHARKHHLLRLSEQVAFRLRQRFVGRTFPVLLEQEEQGRVAGYTPNFLRVSLPLGPYNVGDLIWTQLVENQPDQLLGQAM